MCGSLSIDNQQKRFLICKLSKIQFEQPTTSSAAETNHFRFFCSVLCIAHVIYVFTCIVTQASQSRITL